MKKIIGLNLRKFFHCNTDEDSPVRKITLVKIEILNFFNFYHPYSDVTAKICKRMRESTDKYTLSVPVAKKQGTTAYTFSQCLPLSTNTEQHSDQNLWD